jgi:hypothetical protein
MVALDPREVYEAALNLHDIQRTRYMRQNNDTADDMRVSDVLKWYY